MPAGLSVTGFDDIDLAQATTPRLTTVRQPLEEMGRMAVSLLERHQLEALHVELTPELVIRDSTGPRAAGYELIPDTGIRGTADEHGRQKVSTSRSCAGGRPRGTCGSAVTARRTVIP
ncbi:substrate-binding domain-containing protein [Catellatospora sp. NPDC049133]|uniref:substrate-binding domain-containing protein n=1 Tax=Catellatospora sp. NPDC049133 TaxID=3155499 RepID=UPI0033F95EC0